MYADSLLTKALTYSPYSLRPSPGTGVSIKTTADSAECRLDRMVIEPNLGSPAAMLKDADPLTFCEIYYLRCNEARIIEEKIVSAPFL